MWFHVVNLLRIICSVTIFVEGIFVTDHYSSPKASVNRSHMNITRIYGPNSPMLPFLFNRIKPLKTERKQAKSNLVYEIADRDSVVVEAENATMFINEIPDPVFNFKPVESKFNTEIKCESHRSNGICLSKETCHKRSGTLGNLCKAEKSLHCCTFIHTCGDSSSERVSYFRSPPNTSSKSQGSLACDYDVVVQKETCAVRIEYLNVNLARKLGGVCDIDQIYILNSIDGPTTGQCGPLSGYATTVAVKPKQNKPLKIALLIQNDVTYAWDIKLTQLSCNEIYEFKGKTPTDLPADLRFAVTPQPCGITYKELTPSESHFTPTYSRYSNSFQFEYDSKPVSHDIWWSYPEPIFNMYYYSTTKKHLLQQKSGASMLSRMDMAERRIVGGFEAGIQEFPWQVAIALDGVFFCGGALINENFVVTAAHCVLTRDTPIKNLKVHIGDHNLMLNNETVHVTKHVGKILFHSHFHPFLLDNDIALMHLDSPVQFGENVQPICLPDPNETYTSKKATVVGWGITSYPMGIPSTILQKIQVEVVSNFHCSRIIEETIGPGMICAAPAALQGTCFGDSGGPLSIENESGKHTLIGIVSYGLTGCALVPAFPDIYTRVSEYIKWIEVNVL